MEFLTGKPKAAITITALAFVASVLMRLDIWRPGRQVFTPGVKDNRRR